MNRHLSAGLLRLLRLGSRGTGVALPLVLAATLLSADLNAQASTTVTQSQPTQQPSGSGHEDAERAEQAERLFQRGTAAYEARHYERAYGDLKEAFRLYPTFRTACGLGQIELHLEHFRDAAEHLEFCISRLPSHGDPAVRESILNGLSEARRHVAVFVPQVSERGATVFVNAEPVGVTPLGHDLYVEPGRRRVTVKKPGFTDAAVELFFPAGGRRQVRIELTPEKVSSAPAAAVRNGGGPLLLVGTALTAATVGFGVTMLVTATKLEEDAASARGAARRAGCDANSPTDPCLRSRETIDRASARRELATSVLLAGAGVGALTGLSYLLWRSQSASGTHDQPVPVAVAVSSSMASVLVAGSF